MFPPSLRTALVAIELPANICSVFTCTSMLPPRPEAVLAVMLPFSRRRRSPVMLRLPASPVRLLLTAISPWLRITKSPTCRFKLPLLPVAVIWGKSARPETANSPLRKPSADCPLISMRSALMVMSPPWPNPSEELERVAPSKTRRNGVSINTLPAGYSVKVSVAIPLENKRSPELPIRSIWRAARIVISPGTPPTGNTPIRMLAPLCPPINAPSRTVRVLVSMSMAPPRPLPAMVFVKIPLATEARGTASLISMLSRACTVKAPPGPLPKFTVTSSAPPCTSKDPARMVRVPPSPVDSRALPVLIRELAAFICSASMMMSPPRAVPKVGANTTAPSATVRLLVLSRMEPPFPRPAVLIYRPAMRTSGVICPTRLPPTITSFTNCNPRPLRVMASVARTSMSPPWPEAKVLAERRAGPWVLKRLASMTIEPPRPEPLVSVTIALGC